MLEAQTPGDSLYMFFDDSTDNLTLDTIYPPGCWQVGTPNKPTFTSAYSPGRALVTDTVLPYPDSTTCYAEFTLVTTDPAYAGRSIIYNQRRAMDSTTIASVEVQNPWNGTWYRFGMEGEEDAIVNGLGMLNDHTGYEWSGQSSIWEEIWLEAPCLLVVWDPNGAEWYADTMRMRFVFESFGNPDSLDGWMIDNLRAGVSLCTGSIGEEEPSVLNVYPVPANKFAMINLEDPGNSIYEVYRSDGALFQHGAMHDRPHQLDVSDWPEGFYFIRVFSGDRQIIGRLIVTH